MEKVTPYGLESWNLWNIFTGRKKYTIVCGKCRHVYEDKLNFYLSDTASSICPGCGSQNVWSHSEWATYMEKQMEKE